MKSLSVFLVLLVVIILGFTARDFEKNHQLDRLRIFVAVEDAKIHEDYAMQRHYAKTTPESVEHPKHCNMFCKKRDCTCGCHGPRGHSSYQPCTCVD